jgi:hypothetical protein
MVQRVDQLVDSGGLRPDARWAANIHRYQLYTNLMLGGVRMLAPPTGTRHPISGGGLPDTSYLRRLPGETSYRRHDGADAWRERQQAAAHDPVAARIVWVYVDTLFRQQIDRQSVIDLLGPAIMQDVDGAGTDAADWLPYAYAHGLAQGWVLGLVDAPTTPYQPVSRAHQEAIGLRPYLQLILPSRVWSLTRDAYGHIVAATIREAANRWRIWGPETSQTVDADGAPTADPVAHNFGRVPMEIFVANDPDADDATAPIGESAMAATALIDLQILQHLSLLDDVLRKTGFPFLHISRDAFAGEASSDTTLGADFLLAIDASVDWKAPDASCATALWDHIERLESMAYKIGGVHRRSQDSVEAHSGLALDYEASPIYATVQRWARRLRDWETRIWRLMAVASGLSPESVAVVYPDDFTLRPVQADLVQAADLAAIYGGYQTAPNWAQACINAKVMRAMRRDVGHIPEVRRAIAAGLETEVVQP